ncbi:MAG: hypothetical protein RIR09_2555 [Pseudomonadota bacterium]|jgi:antitoxin (DNA-binding transcriptional repressor) of toxin-antitoxin stability system
MSTTRTIQRTPDLGIGIRLQRLPVAQVVAQQQPEPPWWWGWMDEDGKRITALEAVREPHAAGRPYEHWPGLWVAVVEGAAAVQWEVSFTPTLWFDSPSTGDEITVAWKGKPVALQLPPALPAEPDALFAPATVQLPPSLDIDGVEVPAWDYWSGAWDTAGFPNLPIPKITAAGNTLSVAQDSRSMSGVLIARALVDSAPLGTVTLTLKRINHAEITP